MAINRDHIKRKCKGIENDMLWMRLWLADNEPENAERMHEFLGEIKDKIEDLESIIAAGFEDAPVQSGAGEIAGA